MTIEAIVHGLSAGAITQIEAIDQLKRECAQDQSDRRLMVTALIVNGLLAGQHLTPKDFIVEQATALADTVLDFCKPR